MVLAPAVEAKTENRAKTSRLLNINLSFITFLCAGG